MEVKQNDRLRFFAENGIGPYACYFCGEVIVVPWVHPQPNRREQFVVHHHHEDIKLVATHRGCHTRHHQPLRAAIRSIQRQLPLLFFDRGAKIAAGLARVQPRLTAIRRLYQTTPETRAKISVSQKARWARKEHRTLHDDKSGRFIGTEKIATREELFGA